MKLLAPERVKKASADEEEELRKRIVRLRDTEINLIRSINEKRVAYELESEQLSDKVRRVRSEADMAIKHITQEIDARERERKTLLKPIHEIRQDAEERRIVVEKLEKDVARRESALAEQTSELTGRTMAIRDAEDRARECDQELRLRSQSIKEEEATIGASQIALTNKWASYYKAVDAKIAELKKLESMVIAREKAVQTIMEENNKEQQRIRQADRVVQDKYRALEQAKIHLGIQ